MAENSILDAIFMCAKRPPRHLIRSGRNFGGIYSSSRSTSWGHFRLPVITLKPEVGFFVVKTSIFRHEIFPSHTWNHFDMFQAVRRSQWPIMGHFWAKNGIYKFKYRWRRWRRWSLYHTSNDKVHRDGYFELPKKWPILKWLYFFWSTPRDRWFYHG